LFFPPNHLPTTKYILKTGQGRQEKGERKEKQKEQKSEPTNISDVVGNIKVHRIPRDLHAIWRWVPIGLQAQDLLQME